MLAVVPARLVRATAPLLIVAAIALIAAAPARAVSDTTTAGSSGFITFHPFTIPADTGCVLLAADGSYNCDPVNVVFPGRSPAQVRDLLRSRGWTTFDLGSTQRLHFTTSTLYSQDVQVFRADGRNSTGQTLRYHVRLWRVLGTAATVTVGAVHHEARVGFFDRIDKSWRSRRSSFGRSSVQRPRAPRIRPWRRSRPCRGRTRRPGSPASGGAAGTTMPVRP